MQNSDCGVRNKYINLMLDTDYWVPDTPLDSTGIQNQLSGIVPIEDGD